MNKYFDVDASESVYVYDCKKDQGCQCDENHKCSFGISYLEGSSYQGFMVKDTVYFGDHFHKDNDGFEFTFGCVKKETKLFYEQKADGILGMGMSHGSYIS